MPDLMEQFDHRSRTETIQYIPPANNHESHHTVLHGTKEYRIDRTVLP
jgi:hypothetical protein